MNFKEYLKEEENLLCEEGLKTRIKGVYKRAKEAIVGTPASDTSLSKGDRVLHWMKKGLSKSAAQTRSKTEHGDG